jgi:hypothetical protein
MIRWLILLPLAALITIISYPANPIAALFADDDGELHGCLQGFQTWDNSLNPSDIVKILPAWLSGFWAEHYTETTAELPEYNQTRWVTPCFNSDFGLKDSLRRYACRVLWLTRNSAYGFMFRAPFGLMSPSADLVTDGHWTYDRKYGRWWGAFAYKNSDRAFTLGRLTVRWNVYVGWKLAEDADRQSMYALRPLAFKFEWA